MKTLETMFKQLNETKAENQSRVNSLKADIQASLSARYADWKALQTALDKLQAFEGVRYCTDEGGCATAWVRFDAMADIPDEEREYFEDYNSSEGTYLDWENSVLINSLGHDEIFINDSGRKHDRGVYQSSKRLFSEDEYTDEAGEVSEVLRNALIESHMNATGCFPGVFVTSEYDNELTPVITQLTKG